MENDRFSFVVVPSAKYYLKLLFTDSDKASVGIWLDFCLPDARRYTELPNSTPASHKLFFTHHLPRICQSDRYFFM